MTNVYLVESFFTLTAMVSLLLVALFNDDDDECKRFNKKNKDEKL